MSFNQPTLQQHDRHVQPEAARGPLGLWLGRSLSLDPLDPLPDNADQRLQHLGVREQADTVDYVDH